MKMNYTPVRGHRHRNKKNEKISLLLKRLSISFADAILNKIRLFLKATYVICLISIIKRFRYTH
jgi:hypothetical protein